MEETKLILPEKQGDQWRDGYDDLGEKWESPQLRL